MAARISHNNHVTKFEIQIDVLRKAAFRQPPTSTKSPHSLFSSRALKLRDKGGHSKAQFLRTSRFFLRSIKQSQQSRDHLTFRHPPATNTCKTSKMSVEVALESPLALALNTAIQPKLVEVGWSTGGGDESALSEYIILMLVNGKTQDQIASELSGDLLNLGPDDPGARDFSKWLFEQVDVLNSQLSGNGGADAGVQGDTNGTQDADMGDASEAGSTNVYAISSVDLSPDPPDLSLPPKPPRLTYHRRPTGPKSMRNGGSNRSRDPRDKRMLNHLSKAMDRSNDSPLHRRTQGGNDRINTHRAPPTGPRQQAPARGGPRAMNNRMGGGMQFPQGQAAAAIGNMTPQQQVEMMALFEQQARFMSQLMNPEQQQQMMMGMGGGHLNPAMLPQQPGKSLFDRVQANPQRPHNNFRNNSAAHKTDTPSSSMDVEMSSQEVPEKPELDPNTPCKWQLKCTREDCIFAHQSPAAKPGSHIDVTDVCSYGARCTNFKCTGRHPSPAKRVAHAMANASETQCIWDANCTNKKCPFKHSTMPACRNGADCTVPDCKFAHSQTICKYNPCTNQKCIFKHPEGHKRGKFQDKVWTADGSKEHVSERKFVDETGAEELIVPVSEEGLGQETTSAATELII